MTRPSCGLPAQPARPPLGAAVHGVRLHSDNGVLKNLKRVLVTATTVGILVFLFLFYSLATTFSGWPWTQRQTISSGEYLGYKIGSSVLEAFHNSVELQQAGQIRALRLLDQEPATARNTYKGAPILEGDFTRVSKAKRWHIGLSECNCWLVLNFSSEKLIKIIRHDYFGPTK